MDGLAGCRTFHYFLFACQEARQPSPTLQKHPSSSSSPSPSSLRTPKSSRSSPASKGYFDIGKPSHRRYSTYRSEDKPSQSRNSTDGEGSDVEKSLLGEKDGGLDVGQLPEHVPTDDTSGYVESKEDLLEDERHDERNLRFVFFPLLASFSRLNSPTVALVQYLHSYRPCLVVRRLLSASPPSSDILVDISSSLTPPQGIHLHPIHLLRHRPPHRPRQPPRKPRTSGAFRRPRLERHEQRTLHLLYLHYVLPPLHDNYLPPRRFRRPRLVHHVVFSDRFHKFSHFFPLLLHLFDHDFDLFALLHLIHFILRFLTNVDILLLPLLHFCADHNDRDGDLRLDDQL